MGTTFTIAEVAERSGFAPTTLRYYEERGLVAPAGRTPAGYRVYDESSLARLAFVARAKQLGCTLEEIAGLVTAWEGERCEPVQARLRTLVDAKIADARRRSTDLAAFTGQLRAAAASLAQHTPSGPCDDGCGCVSNGGDDGAEEPAVACSLGLDALGTRVDEWRALLADVAARAPIDGGVRLVFAPGTPVAPIAELAAAEQDCCRFFRFALTLDGRGTALEVTAPDEAAELVESLFG